MNATYLRLADKLASSSAFDPENWGDEKGELMFRIDFPAALVRGVKMPLSHSHIEKEGEVWLPLAPFLAFTGAEAHPDGKSVCVKTEKNEHTVPALTEGADLYLRADLIESVFGLYRFYDREMGFLVYTEAPTNYRERDYSTRVSLIYRAADLLFDTPSGERMYADMLKNRGANAHPKFLANEEKFAAFRRIFAGGAKTPAEEKIAPWLTQFFGEKKKAFDDYFTTDEHGVTDFKSEEARLTFRQPYYIYDENGQRLVGVKEYTFTHPDGSTETVKCDGSGFGDGYDYGGRSDPVPAYRCNDLAFLWQITGEEKYKAAYLKMAQMAYSWEHWGEGHFLDCAVAMGEFAESVDRMWHAFDGEPEVRDFLAKVLFERGLHAGDVCILAKTDEIHISTINAVSWKSIHRRSNNWNTVCSSGLISAAILLFDFPAYREEAMFVADEMMKGLRCCLYQYAPDGAYIESPGYWSYGTSTYMKTLSILDSAIGETYGYLGTVGLADSFDFAVRITLNDGTFWGYHDGDHDCLMPGGLFYLAAGLYHRPALARFRERLLSFGQKPCFNDLLYYREGIDVGGEDDPLDYYSSGIETATMRSNWDKKNFTFAGLHAGANWALHGDADAGNFVLTLDGTTFFDDPGTENYNVGGYWGDEKRYRYYNKSTEAHNTLLVFGEDTPRGQVANRPTDPHSHIVRTGGCADRSFAVADMTPQYGKNCVKGTRGVLIYQDRRYCAVADEVTFAAPTDLCWIATPEAAINRYFFRYKAPSHKGEPERPMPDVTVLPGGRKLIVRRTDEDGTVHSLRATIVSDNESLHFEKIPAHTTIFEDTITHENSGNELVSDVPERIAIRATGVTSLSLTVVFEPVAEDAPVSYTYHSIEEWNA